MHYQQKRPILDLMSQTLARKREGWARAAMNLAHTIKNSRSEDPYVQVGACILRWDYSVASLGYNGPPPNVEIDWSDRDARRPKVIHAEKNAFRYVAPKECKLLACTLLPCSDCMTEIAAYRIPIVVYQDIYHRDPLALSLAKEFNINLFHIDDPNLEKFISEFQNPY